MATSSRRVVPQAAQRPARGHWGWGRGGQAWSSAAPLPQGRGWVEVDGEVDADQLAAAVRIRAALVLDVEAGGAAQPFGGGGALGRVPCRRSFIGVLLVAGWGLSPIAGGSAGAPPSVGLRAGGGGPVVEDLLHVALGDLHALAGEGAGQLAGGSPRPEGG